MLSPPPFDLGITWSTDRPRGEERGAVRSIGLPHSQHTEPYRPRTWLARRRTFDPDQSLTAAVLDGGQGRGWVARGYLVAHRAGEGGDL